MSSTSVSVFSRQAHPPLRRRGGERGGEGFGAFTERGILAGLRYANRSINGLGPILDSGGSAACDAAVGACAGLAPAFGPFAGFMAGWMNWIMSFVDVAIYPVLAAYYRQALAIST